MTKANPAMLTLTFSMTTMMIDHSCRVETTFKEIQ